MAIEKDTWIASSDSDPPENKLSQPRGRRWLMIGGVLLLGLLAGGAALIVFRGKSDVRKHPAAALLESGQAALAEERFEDALAYFERAQSHGGDLPVSILFAAAQASLHLGQTDECEQYLRSLLQRQPSHTGANEMLTGLLRVAGRNWEVRPYALAMMREEFFSEGNLLALIVGDLATRRGAPEDTELEMFILKRAAAKNRIPVRLADARYFIGHNQTEKAYPLLKGILAENPNRLGAQALMGSLLLDEGKLDEFRLWRSRLPDTAFTHPEMWIVRSKWAESRGDQRGAARCYWEALRLHPDHPVATYRLSQMLYALDRKQEAAMFGERAKQLVEVQFAAAIGWAQPARIRYMAELLESLGRKWESLGWSKAALDRAPQTGWARERVERLRREVNSDTPLVIDALNPARKVDLSDWPLPDWDSSSAAPRDDDAPLPQRQFAFVNSAAEAGISFSYYNGDDPHDGYAYVFEFSGGGVGVLDYDADGWPDLYLTQGCPWPPDPKQQRYTDRLFRNLGNGKFADMTEQAGLAGNGYGQGVAVGDIDNDGLPDLYVANIGENLLFHNNGDGTFTDISQATDLNETRWTVSAVIADLDGDSQPELYDVNYLGGSDLFTRACNQEGHPVQCFPNQFPGEMDQVRRNLGDGRFADVSLKAGVEVPNGKGMGIVAADFDGSRRLSLFIANDTTDNFFFLNQTPTPGGPLQFAEQALLSGLAFSESGMTASCMGIAAGDVNGDDRLDLFVTNFRDEANNLYVQSSDLLFDDRIRQSRLQDPGFMMEGWGAQFFDADLDGLLDLVVANGHLDNYPHSKAESRMPTQIFANAGKGRFVEMAATQLGPYFEEINLGRAVAYLDWNRDGLMDFGVTHVDAPFALLTNRTPTSANRLAIQLRGVRGARDALGAVVSVAAGSRRWSRQLTAGDGFEASNERRLVFGLGQATRADEVTVRWMSGADQTFRNLDANGEYLLIEGRAAAIRLHNQSPP